VTWHTSITTQVQCGFYLLFYYSLTTVSPFVIFNRKHRQDSLKSLLKTTVATTEDGNLTLNSGLCFSIIFRGDWTLDLMMTYGQPNITRDQVLDALDRIVQTYQAAKRQVSNEVLLLRYVWLDADKVRYYTNRHGIKTKS
jgi:hypothetical protein